MPTKMDCGLVYKRNGRKVCRWGLAAATLLAVSSARAEISKAGALLVDISATSLSGLDDGATISTWPNAGTLTGTFVPAVDGLGATYSANVGGAPAVTFAGLAGSVMTNTVLPPATLLGVDTVWSVEIWVLNPTLQSSEDLLAWTDRGSWVGTRDGTCMEVRYGSAADNAVEHYNGTCNLSWSGSVPMAGIWHHIAVTRDAGGEECLYLDGQLRTTMKPAISNLRDGAPFAMGGVWDREAGGWTMLFSGSIAKARVHSGILTSGQVLNNYQAESGTYQTVWTGAMGQSLPWDETTNWDGGKVGGTGGIVWINNGGTAVLSDSLALSHLFPMYGGLTIDNGATLTLGAVADVELAIGATFALTVANGRLHIPGSNTMDLYMGNSSGAATVTVGGSGAPAILDVDRDIVLANSAGSVGFMTVEADGGVYNSNGWFYAAGNLGAQATVTVNGGEIGFRSAGKNFVLNTHGGRADVFVNGGQIIATEDIQWSAGTQSDAAYGALYLNGGLIEAKRLRGMGAQGTNLFFMNGGTMRVTLSHGDLLSYMTDVKVQAGGAVVDIPTNVVVTTAKAFAEDANSTGGGIAKLGGGRLTLAGANTFTGNIDVRAGDLFFSTPESLISGYAGTITLTNDANAAIGYASAGGAAVLLNRMDTTSEGYLTLFAANNEDTVDFRAFADMKLAFSGLTNYTGTFYPYGGSYSFKAEGAAVTTLDMIMTDAGGTPGRLSIAGGTFVITGDNTFTGGTEIDGATVTLANANALGTQAVSGTPDIALRNKAVLRFTTDMDANALVTGRITHDSNGILLIGTANAAKNIDLSNHPGLVVGSAELSLDYTGTLTPTENEYRLGGGNTDIASNRGLSLNNLTDNGGTPRTAVIGTPGIIELKYGNNYSGGTMVTNRGVLFLKEDGLGAIPNQPDADNLYVNGGIVRNANTTFELHANRGVAVGPAGMTVHPWGGNNNMTILGDLSGSGTINSTDTGWVTFAGGNNTFAGLLDVGATRNFRIGNGANFSWSPAGTFTLNGVLALNSDADKGFGYLLAGSGALRKEGTGTLTLSGANTYGGMTFIDAGILQLAEPAVLPSGAGKGAVTIATGAAFEINGKNQPIGSLNGAGTVTDNIGGADTIYLGADGLNASFAGITAPVLDVVKVGSGKQTLTNPDGAFANAEIHAGTLELSDGTAIPGIATTIGGTLGVATYGNIGLLGKYYTLSAAPDPVNFETYAKITSFLSDKTLTAVVNSTGFGATFNATSNGSRFPTPFNAESTQNFAVLWEGMFAAQTSGMYGFSSASDDGCLVFIDGKLVLDNNRAQGYTLAHSNNIEYVELDAGMHEIAIAFYEISGGQGITVWVMLPGAAALTELPNGMLFAYTAGDTTGGSIGTLAGETGSVVFTDMGGAALRITDDTDMTYGGSILGSGTLSSVVKEGEGTLTLTSGGNDHEGTFVLQAGMLVLTNGPGRLGVLSMSKGTETVVFGKRGLDMQFFHRTAADGEYGEFQSLAAWQTYLANTFPAGPNYVDNSMCLGATLDSGTPGLNWPAAYNENTGSQKEFYDLNMFGRIFLNRTGTYTFGTASDDGSMLYINGTLVVTNGYDQGVTLRYGTITLTAGFHDIVIPYRENTGGNALRVYIAYPGGTTNMMPQSILFSSAYLRGLEGEAGSVLNLGEGEAALIDQKVDTVYAGTLVGNEGSFLQKDGPGTLTLTGDNVAYAGGYVVNNGALRVGKGGTLGPNTAVAVGEDGTLIFDRDGSVTVDGMISGTGLIVLDGPGEVYITGVNAFEGTVVINDGCLTLAPGATLGNAAVVTNTAALEIKTDSLRHETRLVGEIVGDGDLIVSGSGILLLDQDNAYTGTTCVEDGATLWVGRASNLGGGGDVALHGGTLAILPETYPGTTARVPSFAERGSWQRNGTAVWTNDYAAEGNWMWMTPNEKSLASSAFATTPFNASEPWYATFRYETGAGTTPPADGFTFIVQNDSRGATAIGSSGGELSVNSITPSIGIFVSIYLSADNNIYPCIGWVENGGLVGKHTDINGIDLTAGIDVALSYDGRKLTVTVTQGEKVFTDSREINLTTTLNGSTAYAGFTCSTGGSTVEQFIGNFAMVEGIPFEADFDNTITVGDSQSGTLDLSVISAGMRFGFDGLELGSGAMLDVTVADGSRQNADYTLELGELAVTSGTATVNVAANGTGAGVLALDTLRFASGAKLVVNGKVSAPGGVLTVVLPTPIPSGMTILADFTNATWGGPMPTLVLKDEFGNVLEESKYLFLSNGRLVINTVQGTVIILK